MGVENKQSVLLLGKGYIYPLGLVELKGDIEEPNQVTLDLGRQVRCIVDPSTVFVEIHPHTAPGDKKPTISLMNDLLISIQPVGGLNLS